MRKETWSTAVSSARPWPCSRRFSSGGETSKIFERSSTSTKGNATSSRATACRSVMSAPAVAKEPAGGVGPFHRRELRALLPAAREGLRAARVEGAAGGNGVEPWHGAVDLGQRLDIVANQRDRADRKSTRLNSSH